MSAVHSELGNWTTLKMLKGLRNLLLTPSSLWLNRRRPAPPLFAPGPVQPPLSWPTAVGLPSRTWPGRALIPSCPPPAGPSRTPTFYIRLFEDKVKPKPELKRIKQFYYCLFPLALIEFLQITRYGRFFTKFNIEI